MYENLKQIVFDEELQIEAYKFDGVAQSFPTHFHDFYVIGLIEAGDRELTVNNESYRIRAGDLMTFNPLDNHCCEQLDSGALTYLCINVKKKTMQYALREIFGQADLPSFIAPVQFQTEFADDFRTLHTSIMEDADVLEKEALFLRCLEQLVNNYTTFNEQFQSVMIRREIVMVCDFLEKHYTEKISLDMLSGVASLNKYSLVRLFTREKGISPYRYLETIRINQAKKLLEKECSAAEVAHEIGFSDQSHFSTYFSRFIGLSPGQYQSIFSNKDVRQT